MIKYNQEAITHIITVLNREGSITNWHWNDDFLKFCDIVFPASSQKQTPLNVCKKEFLKYISLFVKAGVCSKAIRMGLGAGNYVLYGTRTQTMWDKIIRADITIEMLNLKAKK
jgi:hypothetical protein